jgi:O-antigen/teichoic acid export membrane protein
LRRLSGFTEKDKNEIVKVTYIVILGLFLSLILLTLLSPLLFEYLIDKSYSGGVIYVFWTGLSYLLWGVYILFAGFIFYTKKTKQLGYLAVINVILNIVLNYFLILYFGAIGAVYATCLSFLVVAIFVVWRANSLFKLPWLDFKRIRKGYR